MTDTQHRIAILALGLIGGSLAKAVKKSGFASHVSAWGHREASLQKGLEAGVVDSYSLDLAQAIEGADIIVIATPTLVAAKMLDQLAKLRSTDAVITDVASVKGNLLNAARKAFGTVPPNLVLGHPIAGSEKSGVDAANADLFVNHRVILTPVQETSNNALTSVKRMWESTGAVVTEMPVAEHDHILAATSHLPHVLAYALVDALAGQEEKQEIFKFAAGGFRDFTRIASSDPVMWQEISLANRDALLTMLDVFTGELQQLRAAIAASDADGLLACFQRAKRARDKFTDLLASQQRHSK